jgi:hypothetical protein
MNILKVYPASQTIKVVPRAATGTITMSFTDELENTTYAVTTGLTTAYADGYLTITTTFALSDLRPAEGRFYTFTVDDQNGEVYRGRAYCTAQTDFEKYTVNQGAYTTENTYDNEFIVL